MRFRGRDAQERERPLSAHVLEALDAYLAARADAAELQVDVLTGPLFATTAKGEGVSRLSEPHAFLLVRRMARSAGLPTAGRLSPQSLHHAFARNARDLGVPLDEVQDATGHAEPRTTRRYDRGSAPGTLTTDPALRLGVHHASREVTDTVERHPPA